jgi:glycosyltransferase involved in cell wall biosynthesis
MRIAILADFPTHCIAGFEDGAAPTRHFSTWLPQFSESFSGAHGIELDWIVLAPKIDRERIIEMRGQRFHLLPCGARWRAATFFWRDRRRIQRKLNEIQPDLVHGWGTEDVYGMAAVGSGRPALLSMQGIMSEYVRASRTLPRERFCAFLERRLLRRAKHISCESRWAVDLLRDRAPQARFFQVEYGVDPRFYTLEWTPDPDRKAVIFVGTLTPRKGVEDLLRAFATPGLAEVELWICGGLSGRYAGELRAAAPSNVKWLGYLSREETAKRMAGAWCLALPTRSDTSPNVVKEARTIGLPVVTTPCGGQSDYIEDGRNGFLIEPGDISRLASCLARIVGDLDYCRSLGAFRHEEQRAFFQPGRTGEAFARIYRELVTAQPK